MAGGQLLGGPYGTPGNWDSSAIPTAGDRAMIPHTNDNDLITDVGGVSDAIDLALLFTHPGFAGAFGTTGTPIRGSTAFLHVMGSGAFNYECAKDGGTKDVNRTLIECSTQAAKVQLGSKNTDEGEYDWIDGLRGKVSLAGGILFEAACVLRIGMKTQQGDADVTIDASADTLPFLEQTAGVSKCNNIVTRSDLFAGTCIKDTNKAPTINVYGGQYVYNHASVAGEVLRVVVWPGATFNMMANSNVKVIDQLIEHPGARVMFDKSMHTITDHIVYKSSRAA